MNGMGDVCINLDSISTPVALHPPQYTLKMFKEMHLLNNYYDILCHYWGSGVGISTLLFSCYYYYFLLV